MCEVLYRMGFVTCKEGDQASPNYVKERNLILNIWNTLKGDEFKGYFFISKINKFITKY